jgi:type I restriction enzyme R subunit
MVDHFHDQVLAQQKIGGQARAMVITASIQRAFQDYLVERKSPCRAIVAFSGEHEYGKQKVTEASVNGFPSSHIVDRIQEYPYRFLICADKFQTGYDEPLLHTMYVNNQLSGIKAVPTLSRLNRAHPKKRDTFVLDFCNAPNVISASFDDYYRTTLLTSEPDPNKLHDLKADWTVSKCTARRLWMNWCGAFWPRRRAPGWSRCWTGACRRTSTNSTKTDRLTSRSGCPTQSIG